MTRDITEAQRGWLVRELAVWSGQGVLTDDQARAVLAVYGTPEEIGKQRGSRALFTLLALAVCLVGLGVLLLVAYNWEGMAASVKVALIVAGVVAAHGAGLALRYRAGMPRVSEVAFLLGCLLYGAGIYLVSQIFHATGHDPDALWWWAVGVLPFALALDSLALHVLYVALLAFWVGQEVIGYPDLGAWLFGRRTWMPNGAYGLLALAAPGIAWSYLKRSSMGIALYVPLLTWWVVLQPFALGVHDNPVYFIGAVGGLLLLVAEVHPASSEMALPYRFFGALLAAGALVPMGFHNFNKWDIGRGARLALPLQSALVVLAAFATLAAVTAFKRRGRVDAPAFADDVAELARRQWLPCTLILLFAGLGAWSGLTLGGAPLPVTILANAAMVVLALWLIHVGLRENQGWSFAAGVVYFLLWAVLRYIDLFGDFGGMVGAALMFFLCGMSLFGVALYWKRRKEVELA